MFPSLTTLFNDVKSRIQCCVDSELKTICLEMWRLIKFEPQICTLIQNDMDKAAKEAKKKREADKAWIKEQTPSLPEIMQPMTSAEILQMDTKSLKLEVGRPRALDGEAVLLFMLCRAYFDSVTSIDAVDRMRDSILLNEYLDARHMSMPCRSSIHGHLNNISNATRNSIIQAQLRMIVQDGLEDSEKLAVDSFSMEGNTCWPTDSLMIRAHLKRAYHLMGKMDRFSLPSITDSCIEKWLKELHHIDFEMNCLAGKSNSTKKIKKLYVSYLKITDKTAARLIKHMEKHRGAWDAAKFPPSKKNILNNITKNIEQDILNSLHIATYAKDRVFNGIVLPSKEKVLSLSEVSVAFIAKGGREPIIGYKPQIARSGKGFITAFELMKGNPNDATRLVPMVQQHIDNIRIIPKTVAVDDGYSSQDNVKKLKAMGVRTVSIGGSKGKRLISLDDWLDEEYKKARADRSAVESAIFTLRYKLNMHRFNRRGIEATQAEFSEKILVYNMLRADLIRCRLRDAASLTLAA
jgi:IS5 family transposase